MQYAVEPQILESQLRWQLRIYCNLPKKCLYKGTWKRDRDLQSVREELLFWMQITGLSTFQGRKWKKKKYDAMSKEGTGPASSPLLFNTGNISQTSQLILHRYNEKWAPLAAKQLLSKDKKIFPPIATEPKITAGNREAAETRQLSILEPPKATDVWEK